MYFLPVVTRTSFCDANILWLIVIAWVVIAIHLRPNYLCEVLSLFLWNKGFISQVNFLWTIVW